MMVRCLACNKYDNKLFKASLSLRTVELSSAKAATNSKGLNERGRKS